MTGPGLLYRILSSMTGEMILTELVMMGVALIFIIDQFEAFGSLARNGKGENRGRGKQREDLLDMITLAFNVAFIFLLLLLHPFFRSLSLVLFYYTHTLLRMEAPRSRPFSPSLCWSLSAFGQSI